MSWKWCQAIISFAHVYFILRTKTVYHTNSVDSNQTPRSAASDQGFHCLFMSLLGDASYIGVIHPRCKIKLIDFFLCLSGHFFNYGSLLFNRMMISSIFN